MDGLAVLGFIVAGLALFGLLAVLFGMDTSPIGSDPRVPARPWI